MPKVATNGGTRRRLTRVPLVVPTVTAMRTATRIPTARPGPPGAVDSAITTGGHADHGRDRDVEPRGRQHQNLPHGDEAEDRRAPEDVLQVIDAEELRGLYGRHGGEQDDGNPHAPV